MRRNERLRLTVDALGANAEGVCRSQGQVVFVPGALPGEEIDALIVKPLKRYAYGKLLGIRRASPDRVLPPCPAYGPCGGCACQHMAYSASLRFKQGQVADCLKRIGGIDVPVPLPLGLEPPYRYRNKTAMPVCLQPDGQPAAGFYARRSHRVVPVTDCLLSDEGSNRVVQAALRWMRACRIAPYDERTQQGVVRHILARSNHLGELMAVLVTAGGAVPHADALVHTLTQQVPRLVSVCHSIQDRPDNVILGDAYTVLWGAARLAQVICGIQCTLSPLSFFQVNLRQAEALYRHAVALAAPAAGSLVADLYSGTGILTLLLAQRSRHAYGIELSADATRDAAHNASLNGIRNVTHVCERAETALPRLVAEGFRPDIVVLDPPRKGADAAVLAAIMDAAPGRVVYISCNPATQARDAGILTAGGYAATRCQPVDMFCQTADVENILLMEREAGRA